jgi:hypothetical protein
MGSIVLSHTAGRFMYESRNTGLIICNKVCVYEKRVCCDSILYAHTMLHIHFLVQQRAIHPDRVTSLLYVRVCEK